MALYTVDTLTDESDGDFSAGDLSLREAIEQANANPGTDTIVFASGLAGQNIVLTLGELLILEDVIIDGDIIGSDDVADITLSGDNSSRILNIDDGSATLNALTLTDANVAGVGGALLINSGTSATIANTTIRNSSASEGGGLMNYGTATITNSTISGNIAGGYGGGVSNSGTLSLTNTTLSGNEALEGGGLLNVGTLVARNVTLAGNTASLDGGGLVNTGTASLTNTTLSGNYAGYYGGGLLNSGSATLTHATISANAAGYKGGGLFTAYVGPMEPGVTTLANTIVLGNAASQSDDDRYVGPSATQSLQGVNIVGTTLYGAGAPYALGASAAEAAALVFDATTAAPSAVVSLPDARGGVLTDTGGAVDTILVLRNGFAEDAGSNSFLSESALNQDFDGNAAPGEVGVFLTNDARGLPRTVDVAGRGNDGSNTVDLGAVELQDTPTEAGEALGIITVSGPAPLEELDSGTRFFSFTLTRSGNTDGAGTVDFTVTGTGAEPADAADFGGTLPSGTVTFADGASVATAAIPVSGDMMAEGDESFTLALSEPLGNASLGGASTATATILDDDSNAAPTFDFGSAVTVTSIEENTTGSFDQFLAATDTDAGDTLIWSVTDAPDNGTLSLFAAGFFATGGSVTPSGFSYTPAADFDGTDSVTVEVFDGTDSDTITITFDVQTALDPDPDPDPVPSPDPDPDPDPDMGGMDVIAGDDPTDIDDGVTLDDLNLGDEDFDDFETFSVDGVTGTKTTSASENVTIFAIDPFQGAGSRENLDETSPDVDVALSNSVLISTPETVGSLITERKDVPAEDLPDLLTSTTSLAETISELNQMELSVFLELVGGDLDFDLTATDIRVRPLDADTLDQGSSIAVTLPGGESDRQIIVFTSLDVAELQTLSETANVGEDGEATGLRFADSDSDGGDSSPSVTARGDDDEMKDVGDTSRVIDLENAGTALRLVSDDTELFEVDPLLLRGTAVFGVEDEDDIDGGIPSFSVFADSADQTLNGGRGSDIIFAGDGDDVVNGGGLGDVLAGGGGIDTLSGGGGDDILDGGAGTNTLDGGSGRDLALMTIAVEDLRGQVGSGRDGFALTTETADDTFTAIEFLVDQTGAMALLPEAPQQIFDEEAYLAIHSDVAAAVAAGDFTSGEDHFVRHGLDEGRLRGLELDETWYLAQNPDVAAAIEAGEFGSAIEHFAEVGLNAGLDPTPLFDSEFYLAENPDIAQAVEEGSFSSAYAHFREVGVVQDRAPSAYFDQAAYLAANPDVEAAVRDPAIGLASAYQHYLQFGVYEGRGTQAVDNSALAELLAAWLDLEGDANVGSVETAEMQTIDADDTLM